MSTQTLCIRCGTRGSLKCSRCKAVYYCSSECQKIHWKSGHKGECVVLSSKDQPKEYIQSSPKISEDSGRSGDRKMLKSSGGHLMDNDSTAPAERFKDIPSSEYLFDPKRVQQMLTFKGKVNVGTGLSNPGNSCYLNSVLNCLTYTIPLSNYFLSGEHGRQCKVDRLKQFCMSCEMEDHVKLILGARLQSYFPRSMFINMNKIGDFRHFQQEDAQAFAYSVLANIQKDFLQLTEKKVTPQQEETTLVNQLFGGYMQSQAKCTECNQLSTRFEFFIDLSLELSYGASVEEALQTFSSIERLNDWKCETCNKLVVGQKQLTVYRAPKILTITLKRFDMMQGGGKINKSVVFREDLDLKRVMSKNSEDKNVNYELYAVIVHYGQVIFSGHYVAFVKVDGIWWLFDDETVYPVNQSVVLKQNAYMLFYQKSSDNLKGSQEKKKPSVAPPKELVEDLNISSTSKSSSKVETPIHSAFSRTDSNSGPIQMMKELVLRIEVPMLFSLEDVSLEVETKGGESEIMFRGAKVYELHRRIPFPIVLAEASAEFYKADGVILAILPIFTDMLSTPQDGKQRLTLVVQEDRAKLGSFHSDNEIELQVPKKTKPEDQNVEESTYSKLYNEILSQKNPVKLQPTKKEPVKNEKVKRNESCPCGSGKKYKKCHGK